MQPDLRSTMGNGVSGDQGNLPSRGKRDVGISVAYRKQHDWQPEQAVAPKPEIHTLQEETLKSYTGASNVGSSSSKDDTTKHDAQLDAYTGTQPSRRPYSDPSSAEPSPSVEEDDTRYAAYGAYGGAPLRNRKSSVMKDDTQSSITLRIRNKKEDGGLKTEESKTKSNMQVQTDTGQTAYTLPSMAMPQPEEDRCIDRTVARQTKEETSIENSHSMLQLEDTVDKLLLVPQYHDCRHKPETEEESFEEPDSASYKPPYCKGEPLAKPAMEIQEEACPSNSENLERGDTRDDVPTRRYRKGKAEADAKAGATRHLPSDPDGITEQATYVTDAKVGQTQHSPANRSFPQTRNKPTSNEINYR